MGTNYSGRVWLLSDGVDTGQLIPGQYLPITDPYELAHHALEAVRPEFTAGVQQGDIIVAGKNFGCGSSREHAAKALKFAGISVVLAESFARIFFRNAFNIGMAAIPLPGITKIVSEGDRLEVSLAEGKVKNLTTGVEISFAQLPPVMVRILESGGIIPYTSDKLKAGCGDSVG
ncbi:3-isopropylmalate dehydratase small subunit [Desulfosporosinus sp. BICA1-9]|uniref:3-isopropylmalate dehydratase small subunit n=1 Tax=Desulfosporosinus sp. BICA1-9 TaxID=1531958 RepID=UPI00054B163E|nr:3-isopropylmalate dehydratase small subunit [Desulfosporosinus sp. BICA1-9]KJS47417.1 MAG: 3-isopropylmalate dehydratase [Peptococcaceae bacterium BRH_c23]KJS88332.1 MAG: 3-isopropylmalate dehydratase [Desulfosporosinus sp. BICA1-9]HBW38035.1 3-isopropylmalate dehydratase small subunit [Desulfosporosinus sp.]